MKTDRAKKRKRIEDEGESTIFIEIFRIPRNPSRAQV